MAITYRQGNDGRLSVEQMDGNFSYIEDYLQSLTASLASLGNLDVSGLTASIMTLEDEIAGLTASVLLKGDNGFDFFEGGEQGLTLRNVNVNTSIRFTPYASPGEQNASITFTDSSGKRGIISHYDGKFGIISDGDNGLNRIFLSGLRTFTQSSDALAGNLSYGELYKTASGTLRVTNGNGGVQNDTRVYTALLIQSGTASPTATVYENTTGQNIVFVRVDTGQYSCTLSGSPFGSDSSKFFITANIRVPFPNTSTTSVYTGYGFQFIGSANLISYSTFDSTGNYSDDSNVTIELRVYN